MWTDVVSTVLVNCSSTAEMAEDRYTTAEPQLLLILTGSRVQATNKPNIVDPIRSTIFEQTAARMNDGDDLV